MVSQSHFGVVDYIVFVIVLLASSAIGLYYRFSGGKQKTTKEYLMADKNMSVIPVGFSLMASFMSAVTLLGVPSENYVYGTQFVVINISYIFGTCAAAFLYLPVFFNLQVTSVYEYLQMRFGSIARLAASFSFCLQMVLYMAIVLYAPALALNAVTGFSKWVSILSVGFVCTFYSTLGGMKAVLWTDVVQSLLMFAAIFAVIIRGLQDNSFMKIWEIADDGKRLEFFNFSPDPTTRHTFWTQVIGGIFTYLPLYGVNQTQVQRLLTVKNLKKSQIALFLNWPILTVLSLTSSFAGLVVYSKYYDCDPVKASRISKADQLLPLFVMDFLSHIPGLAGLFVSGILCGALSTISSAVTSLAAVSVEDFVKPCLPDKYNNDKTFTIISKGLALAFGFICIGLTFAVEQFGGVLQASLTIFGVIGGPLLGLFSLGMFCSYCNQKGALLGYFCSVIVSCWFGFGATITQPYNPIKPQSLVGCSRNCTIYDGNLTVAFDSQFVPHEFNISSKSDQCGIEVDLDAIPNNDHILYPYRLSYMWLSPIGFFIVIIIGSIGSLLTGGSKNVSPDLLSPFVVHCFRRRHYSLSLSDEKGCHSLSATNGNILKSSRDNDNAHNDDAIEDIIITRL